MKKFITVFLNYSFNWQLQLFIERLYSKFSQVKRILLTSNYVEYKVAL